mgnify:CR=1 FL=1
MTTLIEQTPEWAAVREAETQSIVTRSKLEALLHATRPLCEIEKAAQLYAAAHVTAQACHEALVRKTQELAPTAPSDTRMEGALDRLLELVTNQHTRATRFETHIETLLTELRQNVAELQARTQATEDTKRIPALKA